MQTTLQESLKVILEIQELDIKMIRLMRVKNERKKELNHIKSLREEVQQQLEDKKSQILEIKKNIKLAEGDLEEVKEKIQQTEKNQKSVKTVDEFNALSQTITQSERKKTALESQFSDLTEQLQSEEEIQVNLEASVEDTQKRSVKIVEEIEENVKLINEEGKTLKEQRDQLAQSLENSNVFQIYERLLKNKKNRVVVPIENRVCQGCHITLTAQHENLVRRGERLVYCEYCSRIHYWQDSNMLEGTTVETTKRRRRKSTTLTNS